MSKIPQCDMLQSQIVCGSMLYVADYVPLEKNRKYKCTMRPRVLNDYWLQYIYNIGLGEAEGILVNEQILDKLTDLKKSQEGWRIDGTTLVVKTDEKEPYIASENGYIRLLNVKYVHQLQLGYSLLTGADLDVSRLIKEIRPYRDATRDI